MDHIPKALTLQYAIHFDQIQAQLQTLHLASRYGLIGYERRTRMARSSNLEHPNKKAEERYSYMGSYRRKTTRITQPE